MHAKSLSDEELVTVCDHRAEDYEPVALAIYESEIERRGGLLALRVQLNLDASAVAIPEVRGYVEPDVRARKIAYRMQNFFAAVFLLGAGIDT